MDKRKTQRMGIRISALGGVLLGMLLLGQLLVGINTGSPLVALMAMVGMGSLPVVLALLVVSGCMKEAN